MKKEDENKPAENQPASSQKIVETFAPINSTDRPSARRNFSIPKHLKPKHRKLSPKRIGLSIGFIVLVTIVGTLLFKIISDKGETSATNQVKSVFSGDQMTEYRSPENNFTISLPGFPSISKRTLKDGEREIPVTTYERRVESNSQLYSFEVNDYSGLTLDEKKALEVRLDERVQNIPGAKLTSSKVGAYNGINAIEAEYTYTEKGKDYTARVRLLAKDSKIYIATLIGGDQAKFEEFSNSLRFI